MESINLSRLTKILNSVIPLREYRTPRVFLDSKFLNYKNDAAANCPHRYEKCTELDDSNTVSELARAIVDHHFTAPRHAYAVTKLIIYYYNGVLEEIEQDIARDIEKLSDECKNELATKLIELQNEGALPLMSDYEIRCDNLAKCIVACVLHCFYITESNAHPVNNKYAKLNILALYNSGVEQAQFERDFPDYLFSLSWDALATNKDCEYLSNHCDRCKHKCASFDSNYNIKQLLTLYLYSNIKTEATELSDVDTENNYYWRLLDAIAEAMDAELQTVWIKTLVRYNMSPKEHLDYAVKLMNKKNKKNGDKEK